ncbi:hypothetical protein ACLOJK_013994 [Asimina triloba]
MATVGDKRLEAAKQAEKDGRTVRIPPKRGLVMKMILETVTQAVGSLVADSCAGAVGPASSPHPRRQPASK